MSDSARTLCPHCHVEIESASAGTEFWIRCGGCGRRVMPKSWSLIVSDPEPSALFRPTGKERKIVPVDRRYERIPQAVRPNSRMTRNRVVALAVPVAIASASACMFFSTFYSTTDLLVSGFMGVLLTVFIVYVPALLVAVGTGTITLAFFGATFGFAGNEFYRGTYYFLFGFVLAGFVQFVNGSMSKVPVESMMHEYPLAEDSLPEASIQAGVSTPA